MNLRGRDYWVIFVFIASAAAGQQSCKQYYDCPDKAYCAEDSVCKCNPGFIDESLFGDTLRCVKQMGSCDFNYECKSIGAYCNVDVCDCLSGYSRSYRSDGSLFCEVSSPTIHTSAISTFVVISVIVPIIIVVVFVVSLTFIIYYVMKRRRLARPTAYTSGWVVQPINVVPGTPAASQSYSVQQSVQQAPQGGNNNGTFQK